MGSQDGKKMLNLNLGPEIEFYVHTYVCVSSPDSVSITLELALCIYRVSRFPTTESAISLQ